MPAHVLCRRLHRRTCATRGFICCIFLDHCIFGYRIFDLASRLIASSIIAFLVIALRQWRHWIAGWPQPPLR
jgi:hypothetical protein